MSLSEGDTAAYQVRLTSAPPQEYMLLNVRTDNPGIHLNKGNLVFTTNNWHMYQTVGLHSC